MVVSTAAAVSINGSGELGGNNTTTNAMIAAQAKGATRPGVPESLSGRNGTVSNPVEASRRPRCPSLVRTAVDPSTAGSSCTIPLPGPAQRCMFAPRPFQRVTRTWMSETVNRARFVTMRTLRRMGLRAAAVRPTQIELTIPWPRTAHTHTWFR
jgi:hypothetical protein